MSSNSIWLRPTVQLDLHHPKVHFTGLKLTQSHQSVARRVSAIRDFVRRMPFQVSQDRARISASEVLDQRTGDCHTKGLLFTALCRTSEIPARLRFYRIRSGFLKGLLAYGPDTMAHAVGQAFVDGKWVSTDTYVIDPQLFVQALVLNGSEEATRLACRTTWDGASDAIQHFGPADVLRDYGVFDDVAHFQRSAGAAPGWWTRVRSSFEAHAVNQRVVALRRDTPAQDDKAAVTG